MLAILDYKAGNQTSVRRALEHLGISCAITADPATLERAHGIIFPGVGAAGQAMRTLRAAGLDDLLRAAVKRGQPLLGICLGCQVLLDNSEENDAATLGIVPGRCVRFEDDMIDRYTREEMGRIWTLENRYQAWLDVELAVCRAWSDMESASEQPQTPQAATPAAPATPTAPSVQTPAPVSVQAPVQAPQAATVATQTVQAPAPAELTLTPDVRAALEKAVRACRAGLRCSTPILKRTPRCIFAARGCNILGNRRFWKPFPLSRKPPGPQRFLARPCPTAAPCCAWTRCVTYAYSMTAR